MALAYYRVVKPFGWDGWQYAPNRPAHLEAPCICIHRPCSHRPAGSPNCVCRCQSCPRTEATGGNVWPVLEGHPRLESMIRIGLAVYDATLPSYSELDQSPVLARLSQPIYGTGAQRSLLYGEHIW